ncbi:WhiB family transcriptional regulator, partial [Streptomyces sp. NPDC005070]
MTSTDWSDRGLCRTADPDDLFVEGAAQNRAKMLCIGCPVLTECLAYALDQRIEHGVWGGMTERERRALLRRRHGRLVGAQGLDGRAQLDAALVDLGATGSLDR